MTFTKRKFSRKKGPNRSFKKRKYSKKSYKKKTMGRRNMLTASKSAYVRMSYRDNDATSAAPSFGIPVDVQYRANDAGFDPIVAAGGLQGYRHDQAYLQYNHGTCMSSTITITGSNASMLKDFIVCIGVRDDTTHTGLTIQEAMQDPHSHFIYVQGGNKTARTWKIKHRFDASKFFGRPKASLIGAADYRQTSTTLPTEQAIYYLRFYPVSNSETMAAMNYLVSIEYDVIMTEPKTLATS